MDRGLVTGKPLFELVPHFSGFSRIGGVAGFFKSADELGHGQRRVGGIFPVLHDRAVAADRFVGAVGCHGDVTEQQTELGGEEGFLVEIEPGFRALGGFGELAEREVGAAFEEEGFDLFHGRRFGRQMMVEGAVITPKALVEEVLTVAFV